MFSRPILNLKRGKLDIFLNIGSFISLLVSFLIFFYYLPVLPDTIAVHFDFEGKANGWASKNSLIILPIINVIVFGIIYFLSFKPHLFNYPIDITEKNAEPQYKLARRFINTLALLVTIFLCVIQFQTVKIGITGYERPFNMMLILSFLVASFIAVVTYYLLSTRGKYNPA